MFTDFNEYIINEANFENDRMYYNKALSFYNEMLEELKIGNYIDKNNGEIIFKGSEVSDDYKNLLVAFVNKNSDKTAPHFDKNSKGGYAIGTYKNYKVIIITNLREDKNPSNGIIKDSFIHEFIHYLDFKRSGYSSKVINLKNYNDYYNDAGEFNAYYQESVNFIINLLENEETNVHFKKKFKNFNDFYSWMISNVFDKDFVKNLNEKYKKKLKNRIYNVYDKFFN